MSKPNGVSLMIGPQGPELRVAKITRAQDLIWDAVEQAQIERLSPKEFIAEVREAWKECAERTLKDDLKELSLDRR